MREEIPTWDIGSDCLVVWKFNIRWSRNLDLSLHTAFDIGGNAPPKEKSCGA